MKWQGRRKSSNVTDARRPSATGGRKVAAGGGLGLVIALVVFLLTGNPGALIGDLGTQEAILPPGNRQIEYQATQREQQLFDYASVVLADIEDTWNTILSRESINYIEPELTLYSGVVQSGCGLADSGVGPFYCPADHSIYLDLSFYENRLV